MSFAFLRTVQLQCYASYQSEQFRKFEKLLAFIYLKSNDRMSSKSSTSLDCPSDEEFIQEGIHPYSHKPAFLKATIENEE